MYRSRHPSSKVGAGEAVCRGGVDVTCGQDMGHGSYSGAETSGLVLAFSGRRPDELARDSFPAPSLPGRPTAHRHHVAARLSSRGDAAPDCRRRMSGCGEPLWLAPPEHAVTRSASGCVGICRMQRVLQVDDLGEVAPAQFAELTATATPARALWMSSRGFLDALHALLGATPCASDDALARAKMHTNRTVRMPALRLPSMLLAETRHPQLMP
jgi:hypothetical protein